MLILCTPSCRCWFVICLLKYTQEPSPCNYLETQYLDITSIVSRSNSSCSSVTSWTFFAAFRTLTKSNSFERHWHGAARLNKHQQHFWLMRVTGSWVYSHFDIDNQFSSIISVMSKVSSTARTTSQFPYSITSLKDSIIVLVVWRQSGTSACFM